MATIITKNSQTASAVPSAASLSVGELAVNTADGKLYTEHTGGVVKEIIPSTVVDGGITAAKIASNAVTTAKIADANVTGVKLENSGVTAGTYTSATVTVDAKGRITSASSGSGGGVTSVATGNGLSGGTITSTGTLTIAAPSWNSIGSYVLGAKGSEGNVTYNNTYSAGSTGIKMLNINTTSINCSMVYVATEGTNVLSGTWRAMTSASQYTGMALFVRVA